MKINIDWRVFVFFQDMKPIFKIFFIFLIGCDELKDLGTYKCKKNVYKVIKCYNKYDYRSFWKD